MTADLDYWTPEPIWQGQTAHVIASGPSATPEVIDRLRGQNVIGVNSTILSAPWAPVWFFQDTGVVFDKRPPAPRLSRDRTNMAALAAGFGGMVVTTSRKVKAAIPGVRLVKAPRMTEFPPLGSPVIRSGRSSGQTAISLAVALGANRIELHGFDMRAVDGREHHHREYEGRPRNLTIYASHFLPAFAGWNAAAIRAGVSIMNATPGSALLEFPMTKGD